MKSAPLDAQLASHVAAQVDAHLGRDRALTVGLSGGIDSVVLLHALLRHAHRSDLRLSVVHVNHQLSANAPEWAAFCQDLCRKWRVPLQVAAVSVRRGNSTEAAARRARYAAFSASGATVMALAHNRDDQAETVLLQLLRGAGPRGLSAMPVWQAAGRGRPAVLRPLLEMPREAIARYARRHRLRWVEDESNRDHGYRRNALRHDVLPLIERHVPGARVTLARAARLQAEASLLLDTLAARDVGRARGGVLALSRLQRLDPPRARNALRYFLRGKGVAMPDADRLEEALRQITTARDDARVCIRLDGAELRRFRQHLVLLRPLPALPADYAQAWDGRGRLELPQLGGALRMVRRRGAGIAAHWLREAALTVRVRQGGESLRLAAGARRRTVRNLLQEAALPPWQRERLPFIYIDDALAAVAGLGVDARFRAAPGATGWWPDWTPD